MVGLFPLFRSILQHLAELPRNSGSKHVEALTARVDSVQARHIAAEPWATIKVSSVK
jgi:hypothetical protein